MLTIFSNSSLFKTLLFQFLFLKLMRHGKCEPPEFFVEDGVINGTVSGTVSFNQEVVYLYEVNDTMHLDSGDVSIRIEVEVSEKFTRECPVLFTVRENQGLLSWELPTTFTDEHKNMVTYYTAGRTLCISPDRGSLEQTILVAISSCSLIPQDFKISFWIKNDIRIGLSEIREIQTSPTAPFFFRFEYPSEERADFLFVDVSSDESVCAVISIQAPTCPVLDQENNVQFQGYYQTMSYKAGITIRTSQYPDGFYLVMVVLKHDEKCMEYGGIDNRQGGSKRNTLDGVIPRAKRLTFSINEAINKSGYVLPTLIPLIFLFGLFVLVCGISIVFQHIKYKMLLDDIDTLDGQNGGSNGNALYRSKFQSCLSIASLEQIDCEELLAQSKRYYWSLIIVAVFYCVPVFQLIINYLKVVYRTGEQDICYYNFYCARPLGYVMDFNHIYSNIGYILLGIGFNVLVKIRQGGFQIGNTNATEENMGGNNGRFRKIFPKLNSNLEFGVLQHFGLFYAMGLALILEGLLSGAYHICPNQSNFQFDTSFMYAIAFLGIVKIYQFRHPVYISADITFISLAFVASSAVLGLLFNNLAFKISFSAIHFGAIVFLLLYLYYFGYVTDDYGKVVTNFFGVYKGMYEQHWKDFEFEMPHWSRLILPFLAIFFNVLMIILIWTIMDESNFATQVLAIFVVNLFVYMSYYIIMKWVHSEYRRKLWIQPFIYLVLSGGLWIISLYFFQNASTSWEKSPAESKIQNADCVIYDFYDNHDLWHFLSAGALFCSFMLLLTIDDDLVTRKHDKISVF